MKDEGLRVNRTALGLVLAILLAPLAAEAQQPDKRGSSATGPSRPSGSGARAAR